MSPVCRARGNAESASSESEQLSETWPSGSSPTDWGPGLRSEIGRTECKLSTVAATHHVDVAPERVPLAARVLAGAVAGGVGDALAALVRPGRQALAAWAHSKTALLGSITRFPCPPVTRLIALPVAGHSDEDPAETT